MWRLKQTGEMEIGYMNLLKINPCKSIFLYNVSIMWICDVIILPNQIMRSKGERLQKNAWLGMQSSDAWVHDSCLQKSSVPEDSKKDIHLFNKMQEKIMYLWEMQSMQFSITINKEEVEIGKWNGTYPK